MSDSTNTQSTADEQGIEDEDVMRHGHHGHHGRRPPLDGCHTTTATLSHGTAQSARPGLGHNRLVAPVATTEALAAEAGVRTASI